MENVDGSLLPLIELTDVGEAADVLRDIVRTRGRTSNFYRMISNSPAVGRTMTPLVWALWNDSVLGRRRIEIIILRVSHRCESEYEWIAHVPMAIAAGVTPEQVGSLATDSPSTNRLLIGLFDADDTLLLKVVDAALDGCVLDQNLGRTFADRFSPAARVEILTTVGLYRTVAVMLRSFAIPADREQPR